MRYFFSFCSTAMITIQSLCATVVTTSTPSTKPAEISPSTHSNEQFSQSALQASAIAAQAWLTLVDQNKFGESWDKSASLTKLTVHKDEWIQILEKTRAPLGSVTSRQVVDQRTAKDPGGMPQGDYVVMFYKTVFSHKPAFELLTLYLEDGQWVVLTYQVDTSNSLSVK